MSLEKIREINGVPAYLGKRVKYKGRLSTIVGESEGFLRVRVDKTGHVFITHPSIDMEYLADETSGQQSAC